ncbi:MAG: MFS transporter [Chloroflexi bacterium]|nr:MFS transporter [Chloroflexota bacterium]
MMASEATIPTRNRRPLLTLYAATLISVTGDAMAAIAVPWFVLMTTGSAIQTGIAAFFSITPIVIGMLFGGTLVDRTGFKRASIAADLASGTTILLIPLLHFSVGLPFPVLLGLVFLTNLLDAPGAAARRSMLPELAKEAGIPMEKATAYSESVRRATTMIGAPVAGLLVTALGAPVVLLIDAATFFVSAAAITLLIPVTLVVKQKRADASRTSFALDFAEGFRFVRRDNLIVQIFVILMITNMIHTASFAVSLPVWAETVYGAEHGATTLGFLIGVLSAASLVGALLYSLVATRLPRRSLLAFGFAAAGLMQLAVAAVPPVWVLALFAILSGIAVSPLNPLFNTFLYERIPVELRARVFGVLSAGEMVTMPAGALAAGFLMEGLGPQRAFVLYGVVYLAAALVFRFSPAMRELEGPTPAADGKSSALRDSAKEEGAIA